MGGLFSTNAARQVQQLPSPTFGEELALAEAAASSPQPHCRNLIQEFREVQ